MFEMLVLAALHLTRWNSCYSLRVPAVVYLQMFFDTKQGNEFATKSVRHFTGFDINFEFPFLLIVVFELILLYVLFALLGVWMLSDDPYNMMPERMSHLYAGTLRSLFPFFFYLMQLHTILHCLFFCFLFPRVFYQLELNVAQHSAALCYSLGAADCVIPLRSNNSLFTPNNIKK